jgi:phospholipase/lecithinase/hemolysin
MGARNVFVFALGPLGCIPTQLIAQRTDGRCSAAVNELCLGFNRGLRELVGQFNARHRDANATYLDSFDLALSIISKPRSYGQLQQLFQPGKKAPKPLSAADR